MAASISIIRILDSSAFEEGHIAHSDGFTPHITTCIRLCEGLLSKDGEWARNSHSKTFFRILLSRSAAEYMIHEYLSADHARLDAALRNGNYDEFREGLLRHIAIEQKILFPIVRDWPLVERLHLDHGALAALLVPTPTPAILTAIATILEKHNPIEEGPDGLYEQCERRLGGQAGQILAHIQSAPRVRAAKNVDNSISFQSARDALRRAGYSMDIP